MLVNYNDPVLYKPCETIDFDNPTVNLKELANNLILEKQKLKGYGLAAPQIGVSVRAFAFLDEVAFNPSIVEESEQDDLMIEGCLSFPGLWIQIKRPLTVRAIYYTEDGDKVDRDLNPLESRVFQHELDHLDGVTFTKVSSKLKLQRAIEQAKKHGYKYSYKELHSLEF